MDFSELGLTWEEMLFHAITLVILILVFWRALYKPVKQIMAKRREKLAEVSELIPRLKEEAEQTKLEYERLLDATRVEAAKVAAEAEASAVSKAANILEDARLKAEIMLANTNKECAVQRTRIHNDFKDKAADIVIDIAQKVIEREVSSADNKKLIDECLQKWDS